MPEAERQQEVLGSGPAADLVQHNVYEEQFAFGGPTVRPNDGFWESSWRRFYDDDFYAVRACDSLPGVTRRTQRALGSRISWPLSNLTAAMGFVPLMQTHCNCSCVPRGQKQPCWHPSMLSMV